VIRNSRQFNGISIKSQDRTVKNMLTYCYGSTKIETFCDVKSVLSV